MLAFVSKQQPGPYNKCMSFAPAPQKAPTASNSNATNSTSAVNSVPPAADGGGEGAEEAFITSRTFDLYWVDKHALMYKDGYVKVSYICY